MDPSATLPLTTASLPSFAGKMRPPDDPGGGAAGKAANAAAEAAKAEAARKQMLQEWRLTVGKLGVSIASMLEDLQGRGWWGGATRTQRSPARKGNLQREIERVRSVIATLDGTPDPGPPRMGLAERSERPPNSSPPRSGRRIVEPPASASKPGPSPSPPAPPSPACSPHSPPAQAPSSPSPRPPPRPRPVPPGEAPTPGLPTFLPASARIERSTFMPFPDAERYETAVESAPKHPGDRQDAALLHAWMDAALSRAGISEANAVERFDEALAIHSVVALELMREVSTASMERGLLLGLLWRGALALLSGFLAAAKADRDRFDAAAAAQKRERAEWEEERARVRRTILSLQSEVEEVRAAAQRAEELAAARAEELAAERAAHKKLQADVDLWMPQWREYFASDLAAQLPSFDLKEGVAFKMRQPQEYLRWRRARSRAESRASRVASRAARKAAAAASASSPSGSSPGPSASPGPAAASAAASPGPAGSPAPPPPPPPTPSPAKLAARAAAEAVQSPRDSEADAEAGGTPAPAGAPGSAARTPAGSTPQPGSAAAAAAEGGGEEGEGAGPSEAAGEGAAARPEGEAGEEGEEEEEDEEDPEEGEAWDEEERAKIDWFSHLELADVLREDAERCLQAIAHIADHGKLVLKQELAAAKADIAELSETRDDIERQLRAISDLNQELLLKLEKWESRAQSDATTQTERHRGAHAPGAPAAPGEPASYGVAGNLYAEWEEEAASFQTADAARRLVSHASVPAGFRRLFSTYISDEYVAQLMPLPAVQAFIFDIYSEKIVVDAVDDVEQKTRMTLPDFLYGYFLREYGHRRGRAELRLVDFFSSLRTYYEESVRVQTFCSLLGIPAGARPLSVFAVDFLLKVFGSVMLSGEVREGYDKSPWLPEAAAERALRACLVTRARAEGGGAEEAEEAVRPALARLAELVQFKEVPGRGEALTEALREVERGRFVQLDRLLELALDAWQVGGWDDVEQRDPHYRQIFKAGTVECEGRMSVTEFRLVASACCPAASDRQVWRMCVSALRYSPAGAGPDRELGAAGRADTIGLMAFVATAAAYGFKYDDDTKLAVLHRMWDLAEESVAQAVRGLKDSVARPRAYVNAIQAMTRFKRILEVSAKMSAGLSAAEMDEYIDTYRALIGEVPQEARERVLAHLQVAGGIKTWGAATVADARAGSGAGAAAGAELDGVAGPVGRPLRAVPPLPRPLCLGLGLGRRRRPAPPPTPPRPSGRPRPRPAAPGPPTPPQA
eukprot:tig00000093_g3638.t1